MYFLASLKYVVQYREVKKPKELDVIQKSILFMKDNLENKITLDDIANSVGYSSSHFSNYFTQKTNFPPYDYYNQLKIQKACSYLQFSDLKIKEIAYKLGYFDQFHLHLPLIMLFAPPPGGIIGRTSSSGSTMAWMTNGTSEFTAR